MADQHPEATVVAFDLLAILKPEDLDNFYPMSPVDLNDYHWDLEEGSFDFIHLAQLCGSVIDWQRLFQNVFRYDQNSGRSV